MHVHILNKVWEEKLDDWNINTLPYRETQVSIKLCKGSGADMDSQVDINSCTNACTCSKQGVGTQMMITGKQTNSHTGIPTVSIKLCIGGGADMGSQVDINACNNACTHSKQGVATQIRWLGHKHTGIQRHPGFHQTMHTGWSRYGQ